MQNHYFNSDNIAATNHGLDLRALPYKTVKPAQYQNAHIVDYLKAQGKHAKASFEDCKKHVATMETVFN